MALQEAAQMVGKKIAELCLSNNIDKVCFDRGGNIYHGRVQVRLQARCPRVHSGAPAHCAKLEPRPQ